MEHIGALHLTISGATLQTKSRISILGAPGEHFARLSLLRLQLPWIHRRCGFMTQTATVSVLRTYDSTYDRLDDVCITTCPASSYCIIPNFQILPTMPWPALVRKNCRPSTPSAENNLNKGGKPCNEREGAKKKRERERASASKHGRSNPILQNVMSTLRLCVSLHIAAEMLPVFKHST